MRHPLRGTPRARGQTPHDIEGGHTDTRSSRSGAPSYSSRCTELRPEHSCSSCPTSRPGGMSAARSTGTARQGERGRSGHCGSERRQSAAPQSVQKTADRPEQVGATEGVARVRALGVPLRSLTYGVATGRARGLLVRQDRGVSIRAPRPVDGPGSASAALVLRVCLHARRMLSGGSFSSPVAIRCATCPAALARCGALPMWEPSRILALVRNQQAAR